MNIGFRALQSGTNINLMEIMCYNGAGTVVETVSYDDNINLLPDFVALRGSTSANTISAITIINVAGGGLCIDEVRFSVESLMPSRPPSLLPSTEPSLRPSTQWSLMPSQLRSLQPSLIPALQCLDANLYAINWGISIGYGYFFDVTTLADVRISGMAVHGTASSFSVEVSPSPLPLPC